MISAAHLKGGYIEYEYIGPVPGRTGFTLFNVTVYQYLDCSSTGAQIDEDINIGIFDAGSLESKSTLIIPLSGTNIISKKSFVCIDNPPVVCYRIDSYSGSVELENNANGYILAVERCCRIVGINNILNSSNAGIAYTVKINPAIGGNGFIRNSSPIFAQEDTALVCASNGFDFPFKAFDPEDDSLVYSFTSGINSPTREAKPNPPLPPPFPPLQYSNGFNAGQPMGTAVTINSQSGIISGIAPPKSGDYVVAVLVQEYRKGIKVGETRKELHLAVGNCNIPRAMLPENITNCNTYVVQFQNQSTASGINSYAWDFGVTNSTTDTSSLPVPSFTYPDTGVYKARLIVNPGGVCPDSMVTDVRIFPGFTVDYALTGVCNQLPYQFTDLTKTTYGSINKWHWDFGVDTSVTDVSDLQNPVYTFNGINKYNVTLTASSNKGCVDSVIKVVDVADKPNLDLAFRDSLTCIKDSVMLIANSTGSISWSPAYNIINPNSNTPIVFPKKTTTYVAELNNNGCIGKDSVKVNVLAFITANAGNDTTVCQGDPVMLHAVSQGTKFKWTPSTGLDNDTLQNPVAMVTISSATYSLQASLGSCIANDAITISTLPYPVVNAGTDTILCFGQPAILNGSSNASSVSWQPAAGVEFPNQPITGATLNSSTVYILSGRFNTGCIKPKSDTVFVKMIPKISVNAGRDTSVVIGQSLQLNGISTGILNKWTPGTGLSDVNILNPVLLINASLGANMPEYLTYTLTSSVEGGCTASDEIIVRLFKSGPTIYVPSGFTPNNDGKNDLIRPILAGMKQLQYFRIYNRYGQLLYETKTAGAGWNGNINGQPAATGAYVYTCAALDFTGAPSSVKGSFVLIR